ncbi:MAG: nitroreductase family protein [Oscillospiraceae bacterium]|jgi:nitroreductase|nr:nitroreductase family protein [Oscillospiraceae bacterium]
MTNFLNLAKSRYSVRKFADKAIPQEVMAQVLEAARIAPTGANAQPQRIKVATSAEDLTKIDACTPCRFGAPAVLLVCYDKTVCWRRKFDGKSCGVSDACIVTTHLMLQAQDLGLGTCWVMHFDPAKATELFNLPENIVPVAMLPIGYIAEDAEPSPMHSQRYALEDILI